MSEPITSLLNGPPAIVAASSIGVVILGAASDAVTGFDGSALPPFMKELGVIGICVYGIVHMWQYVKAKDLALAAKDAAIKETHELYIKRADMRDDAHTKAIAKTIDAMTRAFENSEQSRREQLHVLGTLAQAVTQASQLLNAIHDEIKHEKENRDG